jgi:hypothetical protein
MDTASVLLVKGSQHYKKTTLLLPLTVIVLNRLKSRDVAATKTTIPVDKK